MPGRSDRLGASPVTRQQLAANRFTVFAAGVEVAGVAATPAVGRVVVEAQVEVQPPASTVGLRRQTAVRVVVEEMEILERTFTAVAATAAPVLSASGGLSEGG